MRTSTTLPDAEEDSQENSLYDMREELRLLPDLEAVMRKLEIDCIVLYSNAPKRKLGLFLKASAMDHDVTTVHTVPAGTVISIVTFGDYVEFRHDRPGACHCLCVHMCLLCSRLHSCACVVLASASTTPGLLHVCSARILGFRV